MKNIIVCLLFSLTVFLCFSAYPQAPALGSAAYKPIGTLIDIGGYKLHLSITGKGNIAVVLISGAGNFSFDWALVQNEISKVTKVCSYDRPCLAWSDAGPMPRSLAQDVYELHTLLKAAGVKPPLILVGHSIGGIIARTYAKQFPGDVAGMVLVDATSENSIVNINGKTERLRKLASAEKKIPPIKTKADSLTKIPSAKEVEEAWNMFGKPTISYPFDRLPDSIQKLRLWAQSLPKYQIADADDYTSEELAEIYNNSSLYKLGKKPLIIIYSSKNEYPIEMGPARDSLLTDKIQNQKAFLNVSSNSKTVETSNSGHEIFLTEPNLIINAITEIITSIKTNSKLK
jgi:pimeloyl-ACP methyl ester carboxylesterase